MQEDGRGQVDVYVKKKTSPKEVMLLSRNVCQYANIRQLDFDHLKSKTKSLSSFKVYLNIVPLFPYN